MDSQPMRQATDNAAILETLNMCMTPKEAQLNEEPAAESQAEHWRSAMRFINRRPATTGAGIVCT